MHGIIDLPTYSFSARVVMRCLPEPLPFSSSVQTPPISPVPFRPLLFLQFCSDPSYFSSSVQTPPISPVLFRPLLFLQFRSDPSYFSSSVQTPPISPVLFRPLLFLQLRSDPSYFSSSVQSSDPSYSQGPFSPLLFSSVYHLDGCICKSWLVFIFYFLVALLS